MTPTRSLVHLAISNANYPVALHEVTTVITKLMEGIKPTDEDMRAVSLAYQRDPVMCTMDYQELQDFVEKRFS